jgi:hypothetical protein
LQSADQALTSGQSKKGLYGMARGIAVGVAGKVRKAVRHLVPRNRYFL